MVLPNSLIKLDFSSPELETYKIRLEICERSRWLNVKPNYFVGLRVSVVTFSKFKICLWIKKVFSFKYFVKKCKF